MKIGFIGTGVMGSRMVKQILKKGFTVYVYNRTPQKLDELVDSGAIAYTDRRELVKNVDVLCTCLSMPKDVEEVYLGEQGVIHDLNANTICVDFSTVDADTSKAVANELNSKKCHYLDAPVSGGPEGVEQGSLTIMIGGDKGAFDKVQPILASFGSTIEHLGNSGAGSIAKLINQYLVAVHSLAASEAMVTGASYGLNPEKLYQILKVSYGDSRMLRRHMDHFVLDQNFKPGGAVKYVHKDVHLANELFQQAGLKEFTGNLAEAVFHRAMNEGFAELDMSAVIKPLENDCNVVVKRQK